MDLVGNWPFSSSSPENANHPTPSPKKNPVVHPFQSSCLSSFFHIFAIAKRPNRRKKGLVDWPNGRALHLALMVLLSTDSHILC
jgi:hypothetical protein